MIPLETEFALAYSRVDSRVDAFVDAVGADICRHR